MTTIYPKRLIEVDLPIKRISAHARREKTIRHGHISTLHIWWARRPLAACRAVICATLWPDPGDPLCPAAFLDMARAEMLAWTSHEHQKLLSAESCIRFEAARQNRRIFDDPKEVRCALLDFIADFANWDNSTVREYLDTSRALTQAAHEALSGAPGTRPLVVDPFCGGGSIPLEALRVGADAFASDLNPIPVLLNKVVLEYIPKYGQCLADEVRKWGEWIKCEAEKELAQFYPKDADGATPIAYLWARTIQCEGPRCGAQVPLIRSLWLAKKINRSIALRLVPRPRAKRVDFQIIAKQSGGWVDQNDSTIIIPEPTFEGTIARGSVTCPCCGYTTPVAHVRLQFKLRRGGANDARLMCVVQTCSGEQGRSYRLPTTKDIEAIHAANIELAKRRKSHKGIFSFVPEESISLNEIRRISPPLYGMSTWGDLFSDRQSLALATIANRISKLGEEQDKNDIAAPVQTLLAFALDRQADYNSTICRWVAAGEFIGSTFGRQAIPMIWDFCEVSPLSLSTGGFAGAFEWIVKVLEREVISGHLAGHVENASATAHPLPSDSADAVITDPPYYDAVPYSHLADFFYVWLRRSLGNLHSDLFKNEATPKSAEIVVDRPHELSTSAKGIQFYESELTKAFREARRVVRPSGIGTIVFASKTTASWEAILKAVIDAGWIITGSWPIDTEMESRVAAQGQARLASSVHLVCRPRENPNGSIQKDEIGDWRDVLQELPQRIHGWMPRLAEEGVVGADAIFACLGPALEVFSRYSRVEKANGEAVTLKEFLEHIWAVVSREALHLILHNGDPTGFDPDARLTVIWFWVLQSARPEPIQPTDQPATDEAEEEQAQEAEPAPSGRSPKGFSMEYDAARKLAQGLGAEIGDLTKPGGILSIRGNIALLNAVSEREATLCVWQPGLFGDSQNTTVMRRRLQEPKAKLKAVAQREPTLWQERTQSRDASGAPFLPSLAPPKDDRSLIQRLLQSGTTTLDRLHQAMLLFGRGQTALIGQFLADSGAGQDQRFWRLAQALSMLYPPQTEEKRWVDGVLARKKGLGF